MMRAVHHWLLGRHEEVARAAMIRDARDRLERMVAERRDSFEVQQFRKRRAAALKGRGA